MKFRSWMVGGLTAVLVAFGWSPLEAQRQRSMPLMPPQVRGEPVSPVFEGWYRNPDGSYTLSFGYYNHNLEEEPRIPLGTANRLEPAELDGPQPTHFPNRRERGVFTVTVPPGFSPDDRVVWSITAPVAGGTDTHTVPGRIGIEAYELSYEPMPLGSLPPALRLTSDGPELRGPSGVLGNPGAEGAPAVGTLANPLPLRTNVSGPLELTVHVEDRMEAGTRDPVSLGVGWFTHRGPAAVTFEEVEDAEEGEAVFLASFPEPGEYVLRVRAHNWAAADSSSGNQCCWTNGYVAVTVTR